MAELTTYRVTPRDDGWAVERDGASRATSVEDTKAEAVEQAKEHAKNNLPSRVIIHREDGTFQDEVRYNEDGSTESAPKHAARKAIKELEHRGETVMQEMKVQGNQLLARVQQLVDEGNVRRIVIRREGRTLVEFPLAVGLGGAAAAVLVAPMLAAVGAIAALVSDVDILVERDPEKPS